MVCWVVAMWGHCLTCAWVCVACAAANRVSIAAVGGVEAIVEGMQAHVGVAAVQEHGARALLNLTASNGALLERLWWRCMCGEWWCVALWTVWGRCGGVCVAPPAMCTCFDAS